MPTHTFKLHFDGSYPSNGYEFTLDDKDVVNPDEFQDRSQRLYIATDHGFVLGAAFADNENDAIDELADAGKLDRFLISEEEADDYENEDNISYLGNYCKPYDIESLQLYSFPIPKFSVMAQYAAQEHNNG